MLCISAGRCCCDSVFLDSLSLITHLLLAPSDILQTSTEMQPTKPNMPQTPKLKQIRRGTDARTNLQCNARLAQVLLVHPLRFIHVLQAWCRVLDTRQLESPHRSSSWNSTNRKSRIDHLLYGSRTCRIRMMHRLRHHLWQSCREPTAHRPRYARSLRWRTSLHHWILCSNRTCHNLGAASHGQCECALLAQSSCSGKMVSESAVVVCRCCKRPLTSRRAASIQFCTCRLA